MEYHCANCDVITNAELCGKCNENVLYSTVIEGVTTYIFLDGSTAKAYPQLKRSNKQEAPTKPKKKLPKPIQ